MTPTKEELAEDYRQLIAKITGENPDNPRPVFAKLGFLAGFQKSEEINKGLIRECERLIRHSYNCDYHVRRYDRDCTCGASELLQKIRMRDGT